MDNAVVKKQGEPLKKVGTTDISALIKQLKKTKMFDQLCLLVLDASGSMRNLLEDGNTKTIATKTAVIDLISILKKSTKSSGFHLGIVCYDTVPQIRLHVQPIDSVKESKIDWGEEFGNGAYTRIDLALTEAEKMADAFLKSGEPESNNKRDARILLMSDGYCNEPEKTREVVTHFKDTHGDKLRFCCCLLAHTDEQDLELAESLMKEIASTDKSGKLCFTRVSNGKDLRSFFEGSSTDE